MMYLNNSQLLKLIFPFVLVAILYIYSDDVMQDADAVFPTIKEYKNKELDAKARVYLQIQRNKKIYVSILEQMHQRKINRRWITEHLLYKPKKNTLTRTSTVEKLKKSTRRGKKVTKKQTWILQILYPNRKVAIINSKIVHEGSMINGARVVQISDNKVLLKTRQGKKWLSLFH